MHGSTSLYCCIAQLQTVCKYRATHKLSIHINTDTHTLLQLKCDINRLSYFKCESERALALSWWCSHVADMQPRTQFTFHYLVGSLPWGCLLWKAKQELISSGASGHYLTSTYKHSLVVGKLSTVIVCLTCNRTNAHTLTFTDITCMSHLFIVTIAAHATFSETEYLLYVFT